MAFTINFSYEAGATLALNIDFEAYGREQSFSVTHTVHTAEITDYIDYCSYHGDFPSDSGFMEYLTGRYFEKYYDEVVNRQQELAS